MGASIPSSPKAPAPARPSGASSRAAPAGSRWTTRARSDCAKCHRRGADRARPAASISTNYTKTRSGEIPGGLFLFCGPLLLAVVNAELVGQPVHMLARLFPLYEVGAGAADQRGGVFVAASTDERGALLLEVYNVGH